MPERVGNALLPVGGKQDSGLLQGSLEASLERPDRRPEGWQMTYSWSGGNSPSSA
jgi:hypothetical protein